MKKTLFVTAALVAALAFSLAGCGSGGGTTPLTQLTPTPAPSAAITGRAQISLRWPEKPSASRGRLIPLDAQSVRVSFIDASGGVAQTALLSRPPGTNPVSRTTFTDLPPGVFTVQATAYPNADGTGIAQASVTGQATIVAAQSVSVPLTLGTTITRVDILPVIVQFTGFEPITLTAVAYDADNNLVLTNQWQWQNSDNNIISLVPNGATATIQAKNVGTCVVTLTETETGQFATKTLQVTSTTP